MKFTKTLSAAIIIAAAAGAVSVCSAQSSASAAVAPASTQSTAPYTEGAVWDITMVKTKPGMSDDYLKALAKIFKATNDEQKRQGIITDYKILTGSAATQQDYDILLMVEYPNMAALDSLRDKTDPIDAKLVGSEDQQRQLAVKRLEIPRNHGRQADARDYSEIVLLYRRCCLRGIPGRRYALSACCPLFALSLPRA
jgi:hypothetical protein